MARPIVYTAEIGATAALLSTTARFGTHSLDFDDENNWYNADEPLIPETGDWTVEFWHNRLLFSNLASRWLFYQFATTGVQIFTNSNQSNRYQLSVSQVGGLGASIISTITPAQNTWYHIAAVRQGNSVSMYVNGVRQSTILTVTGSIAQTNSIIGGKPSNTLRAKLIDEFRVSNIARYTTSSFVVPTAPFQNDDATITLLHMEENPPVDDSLATIRLGSAALASSFLTTTTAQVIDFSDIRNYRAIQSNLFVKIEIDEYREGPNDAYQSKVLLFSDRNQPFTINGEEYLGLGSFVSITSSESELRATGGELSIVLNGIPNTAISEILNSKIKSARVSVYRALFNATTGSFLSILPLNPVGRYQGFVNNFSLQEEYDNSTRTATNTLVLVCTSAVTILENKFNGRKTNPTSQKSYFPNDISMDRVPTLENSVFNFGAPR